MSNTILITGASGLLGKPLTRMLLQKGYSIHHLSRNPELHGNPRITVYKWDIETNEIDETCLDGVIAIVHLAGEGIAEKRWTAKRKQQIIHSRTASIGMIYEMLKRNPFHQVKTIVSASAIGYYGDRGDELLREDSPPGKGFLPIACIEWEKAVSKGAELNLRIVTLRTGIVLSDEGGALPEIANPIKKGVGTVLGSGEQWMSWIHILDVIRMYVYALEQDSIQGTYNMTAPKPVTNAEMTEALADLFHKKLWLPKAPAFGLKLVLGEMSALVLDSDKVSSSKIENEGFKFDFTELRAALKQIYSD